MNKNEEFMNVAHNAFGARTRFNEGARQAPWITHAAAATAMNPDDDLVQGFEDAGMNFEVQKYPLYALVDGQYIPFVDKKGEPNKFGIIRHPTADDPEYRPLGTASNKYNVLQNRMFAQAFDALRTQAPVEAFGSLGKGEGTFALFKSAPFDIFVNGQQDQNESYIMAYDSKRADGSTTIAWVSLRLRCTNAVSYALKNSELSVTLNHFEGMEDRLIWATSVMKDIASYTKRQKFLFDVMAESPIEDEKLFDLAQIAFPLPKKPLQLKDGGTIVEGVNRERGITVTTSKELDQEFYDAWGIRSVETAGENIIMRDAGKMDKYESDFLAAQGKQEAVLYAYNHECKGQGIDGNWYGAYQAVTAVTNHISGRNVQTSVLIPGKDRAKRNRDAYEYILQELGLDD
jgi:hypothetical protein